MNNFGVPLWERYIKCLRIVITRDEVTPSLGPWLSLATIRYSLTKKRSFLL